MFDSRFTILLTCLGVGSSVIGLCPQASKALHPVNHQQNVSPVNASVNAPVNSGGQGSAPQRQPWILADAAIETAKIYYKRAQVKTDAKDFKGAIADYSEVIRLVPDYDKPYVYRANLRDNLGDKSGALEDYAKAISINPQNPFAYYNRAVTLSSLEKHQEAIADYSQTLHLKPGFVSAHKNRGLNYLAIKNIPNAVQDIQMAAQLYKQAGNQSGYQQMQQLLKALGQ